MGGMDLLLYGLFLLAALAAVGICLLTGSFGSFGWLWMLPVGFVGSFLALAALAFAFLWIACKLVRLDRPQEQDSPFYRTMTTLYIDLVIRVARVRIHATGLEKVPKSGRFLLVSNHTHDVDPAFLLQLLPKSQLAFIAKREVGEMFLVGKLLHKLLGQFINRENDREALKTILTCIRILKEDKASVAVFPEGGIHDDRLLHPFRPGVFKIAQKANVPVVVATMRNTRFVVRNFLKWKPTDVYVNVLEVIPAQEVCAVTTVELAQRIHGMMATDLGPDLVWQGEEENA